MLNAVRALIVAAALGHGVNPAVMDEMARCESTYNQFAVNEPNLGLFQLSRQGKLPAFYARGYTDVFDPAQQSNFTAEQLLDGQGGAWTCYPRWLPLLVAP